MVRIKSLLAKASDQGLVSGPMIPPEHPSEMELVLQLHRFSEVVNRAIEQRSPHFIAEYAHIVALRFSSFYEACHILSEDDSAQQASWLALAQWTLDTMQQLSDLLGIEVPDRM